MIKYADLVVIFIYTGTSLYEKDSQIYYFLETVIKYNAHCQKMRKFIKLGFKKTMSARKYYMTKYMCSMDSQNLSYNRKLTKICMFVLTLEGLDGGSYLAPLDLVQQVVLLPLLL